MPDVPKGALAAQGEAGHKAPSCPLIHGPLRHYILNALWIAVNLVCVFLTLFHLRKLHRDLTKANVEAVRVAGLVTTLVNVTGGGPDGQMNANSERIRRKHNTKIWIDIMGFPCVRLKRGKAQIKEKLPSSIGKFYNPPIVTLCLLNLELSHHQKLQSQIVERPKDLGHFQNVINGLMVGQIGFCTAFERSPLFDESFPKCSTNGVRWEDVSSSAGNFHDELSP
ncbi:hypothetical protein NQ318_010652 [Aromia moschata]|uniref:Uncharacterized protein n=1 Tax=Aromia moschata TaxID=1265417 RepID=A0AAV8XCW3_9CUCU|nr:hypothetical protein NQ318_010652 [Aromia moschata]